MVALCRNPVAAETSAVDNWFVFEPVQGGSDAGAGLERGGMVEEIVFGTRDPGEIASVVDRFCTVELGAGISEVLFRATSVGAVVAVRLSDDRRVVVKAHQPRESRERLQAVHDIQKELYHAGLPCPQPLVGAVPLMNAHATAEALLDSGEFRDTHDPACRRLLAEALAWHLAITGPQALPRALAGGWSLTGSDRLWPTHAHAPMFDFDATTAGAEWIDTLGAQAKAALDRTGPPIAGHSDWSGKHFRFADGAISAIYDWDSLAARSEAALVGVAAITYTTRFDLPGVPRAPAPDEMRAFLDEYSAARATPLTRPEREQVAAHGLLVAAYTARCEHCGVDGYDADADPDSFVTALRTHGSTYLNT
jgi:hypothetical protein